MSPFKRAAVIALAVPWLSTAAPGAEPLVPAVAAAPAHAASAPHVSPYVRAAQRHAQEAASAPPKVNPLMQRRPRVPAAMHRH